MDEENPFYHQFGSTTTHNNDDDYEIMEEIIRGAQQDPKFGRFLERIIEVDKEKYFLMLAHQGAKLPSNFDITSIKKSGETSETQTDTNNTHNERTQNDTHTERTQNDTLNE